MSFQYTTPCRKAGVVLTLRESDSISSIFRRVGSYTFGEILAVVGVSIRLSEGEDDVEMPILHVECTNEVAEP
jgi:hypothetical protein